MEILQDKSRAINPYINTSVLSKLFFTYMSPVFAIGKKRRINSVDVYTIEERDKSKVLTPRLERIWNAERKEKGDKNASLMKCLLKFYAKELIIGTVVSLFLECLKLSQAVYLMFLLEELSNKTFKENNDMFMWAGCLVATSIVRWIMLHPTLYYIEKIGCNLKSSVSGLIYKKVMRLRNRDLESISSGQVITFFASDGHKIQEGVKKACFIVIAPLEVIVAVVILLSQLGYFCFAGLGILLLYLPVQSIMGKLFAKFRKEVAKVTEERMKKIIEFLSNINVIKMNAWEELFEKDIKQIRSEEIKKILKKSVADSCYISFFESSAHLFVLSIILTYYYSGNRISFSLIFLAVAVFHSIRMSVFMFFPLAIKSFMECCTSCKRIKTFLIKDESKQSMFVTKGFCDAKVKAPFVRLCDITVLLDKENIFFISGPVGCGKTALLMTIMNEIETNSGSLQVHGKLAYVSQKPWIFPGTIRQNILFGMNYSREYFEAIINACALEKDLAEFPKGDMTFIEGNEDTLSGGQRARISLARAIYRNADIYLLDDPLSALDANVANEIVTRCLQGLLRNKIVLFASHQTQYQTYATHVLHLHENKIVPNDCNIGNQDELLKPRTLSSIFHEEISETKDKIPDDSSRNNNKKSSNMRYSKIIKRLCNEKQRIQVISNVFKEFKNRSESSKRRHHSKEQREFRDKSFNIIRRMPSSYSEDVTGGDRRNLKLNQEAYLSRGPVSYTMYIKYFIDGAGVLQTISVLLLTFILQSMMLFTDYWFGEWSVGEDERIENITVTANFFDEHNPDKNVYEITIIVIVGSFLNLFRTIVFCAILLKCSRCLHNKMLSSILKAPLYFFVSHPIGEIVNRFSRDIVLMDECLTWKFYNFIQLGSMNAAIIVINCIVVPYLIVVVTPLIIVSIIVRKYYIKTSNEIKKIEASSQSPLFTHVTSTISGITTIRSFEKSNKLINECYDCIDHATEASIMFLLCRRWFSQRIDCLALIFTVCAILAPMMVVKLTDEIDEGMIGVSLTYVLSLGSMFQWFIRQSTEVENSMTSVERVYEYTVTDQDKEELDSSGKTEKCLTNWPVYGEIIADNVTYCHHSSLPPALNNVSFRIKQNEKVGIVGRTGAGKSSLFSMMLRLGYSTGKLLIDGVDINQLPLKYLRQNMSIIPQEPVLFNGTLRRNIDPYQLFSDEDIWNALEKVEMRDSISKHPLGLQQEISGSNKSVGERQLLCLARAILKKSKILLIDEATANVDKQTDGLLQNVIKTVFSECTVLTIAHRLSTIIDCDRIMVIDNGCLVEFDEPTRLLQINNGYFKKLVEEIDTEKSNVKRET